MNAYIDAGRHLGYPDELLHVDSPAALDDALCSVARPEVRNKLQRLAKYGGSHASPTLSANTLLTQACALVDELHLKRSAHVSFIGRPTLDKLSVASDASMPRLEDEKASLELFFPSALNCTSRTQCGLDVPVLRGSFAETAQRSALVSGKCTHLVYTVFFDAERRLPVALPLPPEGSAGCAFAFVYSGTPMSSRSPWKAIEVDIKDLPWPPDQYRRNSRVPKMLPHLFFAPSVETTVYIDAENQVDAKLRDIVNTMLRDCNASFAAQAHRSRSTKVMEEFAAIREVNNSAEPEALDKQEALYRKDRRYHRAVKEHGGVGIDGEFLVRRTADRPTRLLGEAWMRAYLRGADRDQPAFSYAIEKTVMATCRQDAAHSKESCGLSCGQGFINLVGHAGSTDCTLKRAGSPRGTEEKRIRKKLTELERPMWSSPPPDWICESTGLLEVKPLLTSTMKRLSIPFRRPPGRPARAPKASNRFGDH
jgi:hypothetical protein